ncbi:MAG: sigma 54-interacting transcriptional regulator [Pseudomonadota bacterium]
MQKNQDSSIPAADDSDRLLSLASLFEDRFSIDWLEDLSKERASRILAAMGKGVRKGWLKEIAPGLFRFTDITKREHLLDQLDPQYRKSLHSQIADIFIAELPDHASRANAISYHLLHSTNDVDKCVMLLDAGDMYMNSYRTEEALKCYSKVLEDLSEIPGEQADALFMKTAIKYTRRSLVRNDTEKMHTILREALARAEKANAYAFQAQLKMHLAKNDWLRGRHKSAFKLFNEGWSIVLEIDNPALMRSATAFQIFFFYWQGKYKDIVRAYEKSVSDVEKFPKGSFPLLATMMAALGYAHCGQSSQGLGLIGAIESSCRDKGDLYGALYAKNTISEILMDIGQIDEAIPNMESTLVEAKDLKISWVLLTAKLQLAWAYYLHKDFNRTIVMIREYIQDSKKVNVVIPVPPLLEMSWAMEQGILPQEPDLKLSDIIRNAMNGENVHWKGVAHRYQALLDKRKGLADEKLVQTLNLALKFLCQSGVQLDLARTELDLARTYLSMGLNNKAKESAQKAYKVMTPINEAMFPDDLRTLISKPRQGKELLNEILKLGQQAVTIRDNKELVQHIISTINRITGAERGAIFLFDETAGPSAVKLRASKGLTYEDVNDSGFATSMKIIEQVIQTGKGFVKETKQTKGFGSKTVRSCICVPLILRDKLIGVLYHDNRLLDSAFNKSDIDLLSYFSGQAAIALDNAKVYEELQQQSHKLKEEKQYYKEEQQFESRYFGDIIGECRVTQHLLTQVKKVAGTEATVLLLGETGVGKELLASAIHQQSLRCSKPFIKVNISALTESLIPSELFGHEKGAFTGATNRRVGRFELADGGSLFLDEIGDLNKEVQVSLLRVLQNKEFERVGGDQTLRSDFRLIAATNRDLEKEVSAGRFREDLYYRLNVFPIQVPPLRARMKDIPLLAHHFLRVHSTKLGKKFDGIRVEEMDKLLQYDWPGNVRELENVMERGTILSSPPVFEVPGLSVHPSRPTSEKDLETLEEVNRRHILMALQMTKWKIRGKEGAAGLLDVKPTTLEYKIHKLGIRRSS